VIARRWRIVIGIYGWRWIEIRLGIDRSLLLFPLHLYEHAVESRLNATNLALLLDQPFDLTELIGQLIPIISSVVGSEILRESILHRFIDYTLGYDSSASLLITFISLSLHFIGHTIKFGLEV
jgi:hypothetical protein